MNIEATDLFAGLSHETRLRCIMLLIEHENLCVCELTHAIGAAQPHISRHLAQLRELGVIVDRREGLWIHYRINPDLPDWIIKLFEDSLKGIASRHPYTNDRDALETMPNRP